ncbi:hypothetical protein K2Z83_11770 [Oscillochloris sp. ZM17-4]|uniref:hypothetical protein n=1 Tax=Oscillochloris sp. ZM17-4 TaxID=2866714 RepID=UPI001C73631D|nr:hypothetical protein [Oscillochloris sp. ZM17-4]MBX0328354.1 hypothetical protein [Oscillochloris sp. ZM17-4]
MQVISRDWAKSTLRGQRRDQWYNAVAQHIRPGRPTLVVCTLAAEDDLRRALAARGHRDVVVAHYGALRGANDYKDYDVLLAQVYHPNLKAIVREGRALFADDATPLDERVTTTGRTLTDATGATWAVDVPVFADPRLAALLESRREAELLQCAMRGRPLDHPEAQITLLFGLPLPGLAPTTVREDDSPASNGGRQATARDTLAEAARRLLNGGMRVLGVDDLAGATGQSVVTVRRHLAAVAGRLRLRLVQQQRIVALPQGGERAYKRQVLMRRGRRVPPQPAPAPCSDDRSEPTGGRDQADNADHAMCVIHAPPRVRTRITRPVAVRSRIRTRRGGRRRGDIPHLPARSVSG